MFILETTSNLEWPNTAFAPMARLQSDGFSLVYFCGKLNEQTPPSLPSLELSEHVHNYARVDCDVTSRRARLRL